MSGMDEIWFSASDSTASNSPINAGKSSNKSQLKYRGGHKYAAKHMPKQHTPPPASHDLSDESEDDFDKWLQQQQMKKNQQNIAKAKYNNNIPSSKSQEYIEGYSVEQVVPSSVQVNPIHKSKRSSTGKSTKEKRPDEKAPVLMNGSAGHRKHVMQTNKMSSPKFDKSSDGDAAEQKDTSNAQGYPVPILIQNEESGIFELDEEALGNILLAPGIEDKYVCVLAVAGAFRKGKSFLLDFLLRYCANTDKEDWLGNPSDPLKGFKWRQGSKRETTGIMVWSKPFLVKRKSGEEIAVILVDTQGTFDTQSSMKDSTVVFALTMMVSSVLVYNLMNNIQEDDLMNLQTFTSYGIQAQEDCDTSHAFQRLQFLVRDWGFPYETPYGHKGGQAVLDEILQITTKQHTAHQDVRRDIRKCFRDINCYLMPHPGFKVIQHANFDGRLDDIEDEFVKHLRVLVPRLLAPENLVKKEFGGQPIKARDLYKFFQTFMEVFRDIDLPEPTTLVEFAARASSQAALEAAKEVYVEAMECLVGGDRPFLKTVQMEAEHEKERQKAVSSYHEKNKYGRKNQRVVEKYEEQLIEEIDKLYLKYVEQNEAKNVFKAARTPATLFCALMFFYLLSGIFGLFGIYPFASMCNLFMGAFLVMLSLWAYVRYSGEYRDVGVYIDEVASFIWDNFLSPVYSTYMEKPLKDAAEQAAQQAMSSAVAASTVKMVNNNSKT